MSLFWRLLFCFLFSIPLTTTSFANDVDTVVTVEIQVPEDRPAEESIPSPPVDIWDRIRRGYKMPELTGKRVNTQLKLYSRNPDYLERICNRAGKYLYHIVEEVEKRNMPTELVLLPFIESAFQPEALSHAKAAGLWQFIPSTGSIFDLQQNLWRDQRRDVMESTRAALDYFEKLYALFGDWHLALAAYNWGEGSVLKAIRAQEMRGRKGTYNTIRMPRETANYVPKLQAVKTIISDPEKYGINLPEIENSPFFVRISKGRDIDTKTAAYLAGMDESDFRELNPGFNLPVIVASHNDSFLLPVDNIETFMDNLANWVNTGKNLSSWSLYKVSDGETIADIASKFSMSEDELMLVNRIPKGRKVLPGSALLIDTGNDPTPDITEEDLQARLTLSSPPVRRIVYRVHRGDTIFSIARKFGISQRALRTQNKLGNGTRLKIGQRLVIEVKNSPRSLVRKATKNLYTVKKGDTLASVARRHKVSIAQLRRLNKIKGTQLTIGQTLKLR